MEGYPNLDGCRNSNSLGPSPDALGVETAAARQLHDDLLASKPDGARHDSDICPFCVEQATETATTSRIPSGSAGPDVTESTQIPSTEGGTTEPMSDNTNMISNETHSALLEKAVKDATSVTEKALETKIDENKELAAKVESLTSDNTELTTETERLNKELDTAQVSLKAAQDEAKQLKEDITAKDAEAAKTEVSSKRAEQVKNLGFFSDEYVTEKAASWADLSDEDWSARLEEWKALKPAAAEGDGEGKPADTASAMSGTTEDLTKDKPSDTASKTTSARRGVLGLAPKAS